MKFIKQLLQRRFVRFGLVGGISTLVDATVLFLTNLALQPLLPAFWASAIPFALGYLCGIVVNFYIARVFVFQPSVHSTRTEFARVFLIGLAALGLTELIGLSLNVGLGLEILLAKAIAIPIVFLWNYFARRWLVYHK
jgi:putative flippase GtrA